MNPDTPLVPLDKAGYPMYPVRRCDNCNKKMTEGYCLFGGEEYYCSDTCLYAHYTPEQWKELYSDDGDSYWTEWE